MELAQEFAKKLFPRGCARRGFLIRVEYLILLFILTSPLNARQSGKICVAVLFNSTKSNVAGGDRYVGAFMREKNETEWRSISNTNLFAFGVSFSKHGTTERYYIAGAMACIAPQMAAKRGEFSDWQTMEILSVAPIPLTRQ
jgi:hypothetical protein